MGRASGRHGSTGALAWGKLHIQGCWASDGGEPACRALLEAIPVPAPLAAIRADCERLCSVRAVGAVNGRIGRHSVKGAFANNRSVPRAKHAVLHQNGRLSVHLEPPVNRFSIQSS